MKNNNKNKKILIVDDDPGILEVSEIVLKEGGYKVVTDDGKSVDEKIDKDRPDLILLDILMSGVDGRDISKKLKNQTSTKHIPIIILSANVNIEERVKEAQADDFLAKPFDIEDLEKIVKKHLV